MTVNASLFTRTDWITTYSGYPFFPLDPNPADVRIADIAHALANLCRFAGHTRRFYSVAQHSVIVSRLCGPDDAMWGLLHDASEAYLCDITRPVKHQAALKGYRQVEARVQAAICVRFKLAPEQPAIVKAADSLVLRTEQRDLMAMPEGWVPGDTLPYTLTPQRPEEAERSFKLRFFELGGRA